MQLVGVVGLGQQLRHRPEGLAAEVAVEARGHHAHAAAHQAERDVDDTGVEKLHLVDADDERRRQLGVDLESSLPAIEMERRRLPACETTSVSPWRSSRLGLNSSGDSWAISARRMRRSNSSLLPENMGPQMTSSEPPRAGRKGITARSLGPSPDGAPA